MTTECNQTTFEFHGLNQRKVKARFDGGKITSDAGVLLLREVEKRTGLIDGLAECFADHRDPRLIEHTVKELIGQRVYGLCLGYEDLNDHDQLRTDPMLAVAVDKADPLGGNRRQASDRGKALAAKCTLNRLELTGAEVGGEERYKKIAMDSVVAWIGAEMEFALSQAVASGDTFEHRPSECGHCVQDFLADLDLRDLPGEAAGSESGADDALPPADLRFYPAALVVPCGHLPGHAAVAADLGNMAIPNGWIPRRLRADHCVLWRRYNHIQGLPIPFPQQIPCGRSIIGAVRQKARDRGIELIQEPGQGGAVSNVIVSQIGANNRTAMEVQSEVEFAPAAAYSLDLMLLREPFPFAEDLEAGTVHHQMDRHRSGLPHHLSDAQAICATRQCGVIRHPYVQPHERADGSHKSLRLSQPKPIRRAQRQACLDRQIRVSPLATP